MGTKKVILKFIKTVFFLLLISFSAVYAEEEFRLTIVHSNDLHSHLMSFGPSMDFTYETDDDNTIGGFARIATFINEVKSKRENPVLVLDSGDFSMGTMFHTLVKSKAYELRIMKKIGYDVLTLGNHEFDFTPKGLAETLRTAEKNDSLPSLVFSSFIFSKVDSRDDSLTKAYNDGLIKNYVIRNFNGVKVGIFGLMGKDAALKASYSAPVRFSDPVKTAHKMVRILKEQEKADIIICLSHGGMGKKGGRSEDSILADSVDGIDIIVSGHSHTPLKKPVKINNTLIVQAGYYGRGIGVLDIVKKRSVNLSSYEYVRIDDKIQSDLSILRDISDFRDEIDKGFFEHHGFKSRDIVGETSFDLKKEASDCGLGNLLSDSVGWYVNKYSYNKDNPVSKVMVSIVAHGMVRESILKGKTGKLSVGELFKILPMGVGSDGSVGYPLVSFYIYPHELKKGLEIVTSLRPIMGDSLFLHFSGVKFKYNPNRMIFDKISEIKIGNDINGYRAFDYSKSGKKLIRIATNIYVAGFLKMVGKRTWNILRIVPKDEKGIPVRDMKDMIVDSDEVKPGVQELKEWKAPIEFISSFKDLDSNAISDIPEEYSKKRGSIIMEKTVNPLALIKNGTIVTWLGFLLVLTVFFIMIFITTFILNRLYPDRFIRSKSKS